MTNTKHKDYKKYIKNLKELDKVMDKMRGIEMIELEKPIKDGWSKTYTLRKDILRSPEGSKKEKCLRLVVVPVWSRDKSFIFSYSASHLRFMNEEFDIISSKGSNYKILRKPGLRKISEKEYNELEPSLQPYFVEISKTSPWGNTYSVYELNINRYELETRTYRSYITHRRILDPQLEVEKSRLCDQNLMLLHKGLGNMRNKDYWFIRKNDPRLERKKWNNNNRRLNGTRKQELRASN